MISSARGDLPATMGHWCRHGCAGWRQALGIETKALGGKRCRPCQAPAEKKITPVRLDFLLLLSGPWSESAQ